MQVLATFPGRISPLSEDIYEDILTSLMSVITARSDDAYLWRTALEALVQIGVHIEKFSDAKKQFSYSKFVVERIASVLSLDDVTTSLTLKLEAISEFGFAGPDFKSAVIQGLEEAISSSFSDFCVCFDSLFF